MPPEGVVVGDRYRRPFQTGPVARGAAAGRARLRAAAVAGCPPTHRPAPPGGPGPGEPAAARGQAGRPGRGRLPAAPDSAAAGAGRVGSGRGGAAGLDRYPAVGPTRPGWLGVPAVLPRSHYRRPPAPPRQWLSGSVRRPLLGLDRRPGPPDQP